MARSLARKVMLAQWVGSPSGEPFRPYLAFDDDEFVEVLPLGGLDRPFVRAMTDAQAEAGRLREAGEDFPQELVDRLLDLDGQYRQKAVTRWLVRVGDQTLPLPSEDPAVLDRQDVSDNLSNALKSAIISIWSNVEALSQEEERRLGEGLPSARPSAASADTPSSTPTSSPGRTSRSKSRASTETVAATIT